MTVMGRGWGWGGDGAGDGEVMIEMGRKKREAKATYCGDRVWGQESLLASVGSL